MQNFADYYSTMLARQLFKESRQQNANKNTTPDVDGDAADQLAAQDLQDDLLAYTIFHNPGCGYQSGQETKGQGKPFLKRWLSFYQPDPAALPQHGNLERLEARKLELNKKHARLTAPLLVTLLLGVVIVALLLLWRDSLLLLLIPVVLLLVVWLQIRSEVKASNRLLRNNRQLRRQQQALLEQLTEQVGHINALDNVLTLQENYTRTLEAFLREQLNAAVPYLDDTQIKAQLQAGGMEVFILESPGLLQIPDLCGQSPERLLNLGALVRPGAEIWCAEQPYAELEGLTRIHFVQAALLLERGLVLCQGYYDWVSDRMYAVTGDCFYWQNVIHTRLFETGFPVENVLSEDLSDTAYQAYFGDRVQVFTVSIRNGEQYCCALPVHAPLRQTLSAHMPGTLLVRYLKRDVKRLHSVLSNRIQQHQAGTRSAGKVALSAVD